MHKYRVMLYEQKEHNSTMTNKTKKSKINQKILKEIVLFVK